MRVTLLRAYSLCATKNSNRKSARPIRNHNVSRRRKENNCGVFHSMLQHFFDTLSGLLCESWCMPYNCGDLSSVRSNKLRWKKLYFISSRISLNLKAKMWWDLKWSLESWVAAASEDLRNLYYMDFVTWSRHYPINFSSHTYCIYKLRSNFIQKSKKSANISTFIHIRRTRESVAYYKRHCYT